MVAGNATKGGAAEPGVNVNGCQCQSVKFLMAPDLGVERKSLTFPSSQSADVCTVCTTNTQHNLNFSLTRVVSRISTLPRLPSHKTFALWTHSRITPESQVSSFESSLSEEQMPGRRQFCRKSATPLRSRKYLGLIHRELAIRTIGYVLVPRGTFILIISPG